MDFYTLLEQDTQEKGLFRLIAKANYGEPAPTESYGGALSQWEFDVLTKAYQTEYVSYAVLQRGIVPSAGDSYKSDTIAQLYNKVVAICNKNFIPDKAYGFSQESLQALLQLLLCDQDSLFYYNNNGYITQWQNHHWQKANKQAGRVSLKQRSDHVKFITQQTLPSLTTTGKYNFETIMQCLIKHCGQRPKDFLNSCGIDLDSQGVHNILIDKELPSHTNGPCQDIRNLLCDAYRHTYQEEVTFDDSYCFWTLYYLTTYVHYYDQYRQHYQTKDTTSLLVHPAQVARYHTFEQNFAQYTALFQKTNEKPTLQIDYALIEAQDFFSIGRNALDITPEVTATADIIGKLYNSIDATCLHNLEILKKRVAHTFNVMDKGTVALRPYYLFLMVCCCKKNIDTKRIASYECLDPSKRNLCIKNFQLEYLSQLTLMAELCQLFQLSPEDCAENWKCFFKTQKANIFSHDIWDFWSITMTQQKLTFQMLPQIGKQLFLLDLLKFCLPMHLARLSFKSVNSNYRNGEFRTVIAQERQSLIGYASRLSSPVLQEYKRIWNDGKLYLTRGADCVRLIFNEYNLSSLFWDEDNQMVASTQTLDEKTSLTVEFCLQLALRKRGMGKLIQSIDKVYGLSFGKLLSDAWQYEVLTTEL